MVTSGRGDLKPPPRGKRRCACRFGLADHDLERVL